MGWLDAGWDIAINPPVVQNGQDLVVRSVTVQPNAGSGPIIAHPGTVTLNGNSVPTRTEAGAVYLFDDNTAGESTIGMYYAVRDAVNGHTVYGGKNPDPSNILESSTDGSSIVDKFTFTAGELITCIKSLATGTLMVCTTDVKSTSSPSTFTYIYRSTNGGTSFTKVASSAAVIGSSDQIIVGNWVSMFGMDSNGTAICAGLYGYKANSTARYVYRSTDDGVTWKQALDIGANSNRHVHTVFADPSTGHFWVTTGDDNTSGAGNVGGRNVWVSTDSGVTWTAYSFLDADGSTRLQFFPITLFRGQIYAGEDNDARGRIWRLYEASLGTGTLEVAYDPDLDGTAVTNAGLTGSSPWIAPVYSLGVDSVNGVIYAYMPGESAAPYTNHGRIMASADGTTWHVVCDTGSTGVVPGAAIFSPQDFAGGHFVFYYNYRLKRRLPYRAQGIRPVDHVLVTASIPGAVATQAEVLALNANMLGFSFRVVRAGIFIQTAQTGGNLTGAFKRNGSTISTTEAVVAAGAVTTARYAQITLLKTAISRFIAETSDLLTCDITNAGTGGSGLFVWALLEKQMAPLLAN